ncbi:MULTISPECIES: hypothetical protein [Streptomyces]|nr:MULTISPECIES: hypothetical protein [Streptomyces]
MSVTAHQDSLLGFCTKLFGAVEIFRVAAWTIAKFGSVGDLVMSQG